MNSNVYNSSNGNCTVRAKHIERPFMQGKIEYFDANLLEGNSVVDLNEKEL